MLQKQCQVIIAAYGMPKKLLEKEFPQLQFISLEGYAVKYGYKNTFIKLIFQIPKILKSIKRESSWLSKIATQYKIDAIISDNRYGLNHSKIPCILITHQLHIMVPPIIKWTEGIIQKKLYRWINQFSECWVPDVENENHSLAGKLSHPFQLPVTPVKYIGWLSRFNNTNVVNKKYNVIICLSGIEPQRSVLEQIILSQLPLVKGTVLLVRGIFTEDHLENIPAHVEVVNNLDAHHLQIAFQQSEYIVSRCGYSTVMDMMVLKCKCIFIPTPGQTEQEYLAKWLSNHGTALIYMQNKFNLFNALHKAASFNYNWAYQTKDILEESINNLLDKI